MLKRWVPSIANYFFGFLGVGFVESGVDFREEFADPSDLAEVPETLFPLGFAIVFVLVVFGSGFAEADLADETAGRLGDFEAIELFRDDTGALGG